MAFGSVRDLANEYLTATGTESSRVRELASEYLELLDYVQTQWPYERSEADPRGIPVLQERYDKDRKSVV